MKDTITINEIDVNGETLFFTDMVSKERVLVIKQALIDFRNYEKMYWSMYNCKVINVDYIWMHQVDIKVVLKKLMDIKQKYNFPYKPHFLKPWK